MLIVNKHCAIFTPSIKRRLGKVPKVSAQRRFHCSSLLLYYLHSCSFKFLFANWFKFISVQIGLHSNTEVKFPVHQVKSLINVVLHLLVFLISVVFSFHSPGLSAFPTLFLPSSFLISLLDAFYIQEVKQEKNRKRTREI